MCKLNSMDFLMELVVCNKFMKILNYYKLQKQTSYFPKVRNLLKFECLPTESGFRKRKKPHSIQVY